jgi:hypothetical protein
VVQATRFRASGNRQCSIVAWSSSLESLPFIQTAISPDWFSRWKVLVNLRHAEANLLKITPTYVHAFDTRFS